MTANITANADGTYKIIMDGISTIFTPTTGLTGYNRVNHTAYGNITILEDSDLLCNLSICDLTLAQFDYRPSIGGNSLYAAIFGLCVLMNIFYGIRYRTWGYMAAMLLGMSGEVVGYIGRILLWQNPFDPTGNNFLIYLVCLTIAPAFLSAGIYLCLARIVVVYGEHLSRFRPGTYTLIFCGCDLLSLILQAAGGGIASNADTQADDQLGINIMLAGLSTQVASILLFAVLCAEFAWRLYKNPQSWSMEHVALFESRKFKTFLCGLCVATLAIFIRSVFRVAELSQGFHGSLANNEISFMILEGAMIAIASLCLTILHPGAAFQGVWDLANFKFRKSKGSTEDKEMQSVEGRSTKERGDSIIVEERTPNEGLAV